MLPTYFGNYVPHARKHRHNASDLPVGVDASTTQKGLASFDTADFVVVSGAVTLKNLALVSMTQTNLAVTFSSVAGTNEQEVTGLRTSIPIITTGTCTVKFTLKVYIIAVAGNNTVRLRVGTSTTYLSNTEKDNLYIGGAKTVETLTGVVVITGVDLSTQTYGVVSVQNDVNALGLDLSASGSRSTLVVEVYQ